MLVPPGDATKPLREPTGKPAETAAEDSNAAIETVAPEAAVDTHNGISEDVIVHRGTCLDTHVRVLICRSYLERRSRISREV